MTEPLRALRAAAVRTLDGRRPTAEALAWRGDTIAAVGSYDQVRDVTGAAVEWLDLRPATVYPGFTDSHIHLVEYALGRARPDLADAGSGSAVLDRVRSTAREHPPDAWLEFAGFDAELGSQLTLQQLDDAGGGRAVALIAHDLHSGWFSSEALRRLGVEAGRDDPPGGTIERDANGRPTGVLRERALDWWYEARPRPSAAERRRAVLEAQAALHRFGVTGVHSVEGPESFRIVRDLEAADELRLRVLHHMPQRALGALIDCGITSGFGGPWLRIGGIKIFTDGALGSRTAWMLEPYEDTGERGIRRLDPDELADDVARAASAGLSSTVHAIGDAAVRMTLDALEAAPTERTAVPHRIEHLQCVRPEDLGRAGRAGIVASMQPSHMLTDIPIAERAWGERCRGAFAFRDLLDAKTVLAFGSDAPVESPDPREGIYAARTRRDRAGRPAEGWYPDQRLSGLEILRAYTVGPARAAGAGDDRGRLVPGEPADMVAWDRDLAAVEPDAVREAGVLATIIGGALVHRAG